jgi:hypothetical protein
LAGTVEMSVKCQTQTFLRWIGTSHNSIGNRALIETWFRAASEIYPSKL